jgi:MoaE-MoaD fusion protein
MRITVLAFGILRDWLPASASRDLPDGSTVDDLLGSCLTAVPAQAVRPSSLAVAVNREYAGGSHPLADGDEVALLPPVSGGSGEEPGDEPWVRLIREPIVPAKIIAPLERPQDGAVVVFDGIVRDHSRGRATRFLEYEAYEAMALAQMQALAGAARRQFAIRNVALVHRLGRLEIGEPSVLIAVYSAHRAAAFDACRWLIDTLKQTVPIWKKEFFADGAVWAQGEPFPPELTPRAGTRAERSQ